MILVSEISRARRYGAKRKGRNRLLFGVWIRVCFTISGDVLIVYCFANDRASNETVSPLHTPPQSTNTPESIRTC
jgi:hypothetical protein